MKTFQTIREYAEYSVLNMLRFQLHGISYLEWKMENGNSWFTQLWIMGIFVLLYIKC